MKFYRFLHGGSYRYGVLEGEELVCIDGTPFSHWKKTETQVELSDAVLGPPCLPSKVVCVGLNYRDHAAEFGNPLPDEPCLFMKPSTAVIGPGEDIVYPAGVDGVDYEAELAVVMGKEARHVDREEALEYVLGYCCLNDVTARKLQRKDGQWTRAKSFDTFCPIGPCVCTGIDPGNLSIELRLNGELKQSSRTSNLIFAVDELVSFVSSVMTLLPGDVISTGTPSGVGPVRPGDVVDIKIDGIGVLRNNVIPENIAEYRSP